MHFCFYVATCFVLRQFLFPPESQFYTRCRIGCGVVLGALRERTVLVHMIPKLCCLAACCFLQALINTDIFLEISGLFAFVQQLGRVSDFLLS